MPPLFNLTITVLYVITAILAFTYASFELRFFIAFLRKRAAVRAVRDRKTTGNALTEAPTVTIQIPLFNERTTAENIIRAAAAQAYPAFDIQVLDDSTDDTQAIVARVVGELSAKGIRITHVRRPSREGYKAGALAYGLTLSTSTFVAIFDADFSPGPHFLRELILDMNVFADPQVGFAQARWGFVNGDENLLTAVQRLFMERHFFIQKPTWMTLGRVTMFNGSGGIWRRSTIEAAGGWSSDTLTEDLDLSYRTAMAGFKGVYVGSVAANSELPAHVLSFKLQQRRWAKGSAQAGRKLVGKILRSPRLQSKPDELFIVGGYLIHPILLLNTLLWPWAVVYAQPRDLFLIAQFILSLSTVVGPISFALTAREVGRPLSFAFVREVLTATLLGIGLMVNNGFAHLFGYWSRQAAFERTPKRAQAGTGSSYRLPQHWTILVEATLLAYSLASAAWLGSLGEWMWVPPCFVWAAALTLMIGMQLQPQAQREKEIA